MQVREAIPLAILLILSFLPGTTQAQTREESLLRLQQTIAAFYDAIERGDTDRRLEMFADDAILMPNHWTMIVGKQMIARAIRTEWGVVFRIKDRKIVRMEMDTEVAYTVNSYYYSVYPEGEEPTWHKTKNVHIWRRQPDGTWKLQVDIFNSDVPLQ